MPESFIDNYKAKHRHPLNKLTHSIGIPLIVVSLPLLFFNWRWALLLFAVGWAFQFFGHFIEGNQPAFFKNPGYLLVGPWWLGASRCNRSWSNENITLPVTVGLGSFRVPPFSNVIQ